MPQRLIAKIDTHLKADNRKHSKDQPDTDKIRVEKGDVIEAASFPMELGFFIVRDGMLKGQLVPSHIMYALESQWSLEEAPVVQAPVDAAPVANAPETAASEDKMARARAMLAAGQSVSAIAKELRIGRAAIKRLREEA